jgi:hypothetical protein
VGFVHASNTVCEHGCAEAFVQTILSADRCSKVEAALTRSVTKIIFNMVCLSQTVSTMGPPLLSYCIWRTMCKAVSFSLDDRSTVLGVPMICLSGVLWLLGKHMDDLFLDISAPQSPQSNVDVGWYDCSKALLTQVIAQHTVMLAADFLKVSSFFGLGSLWVFFKILRMWEMPWELNRRKRERGSTVVKHVVFQCLIFRLGWSLAQPTYSTKNTSYYWLVFAKILQIWELLQGDRQWLENLQVLLAKLRFQN